MSEIPDYLKEIRDDICNSDLPTVQEKWHWRTAIERSWAETSLRLKKILIRRITHLESEDDECTCFESSSDLPTIRCPAHQLIEELESFLDTTDWEAIAKVEQQIKGGLGR